MYTSCIMILHWKYYLCMKYLNESCMHNGSVHEHQSNACITRIVFICTSCPMHAQGIKSNLKRLCTHAVTFPGFTQIQICRAYHHVSNRELNACGDQRASASHTKRSSASHFRSCRTVKHKPASDSPA